MPSKATIFVRFLQVTGSAKGFYTDTMIAMLIRLLSIVLASLFIVIGSTLMIANSPKALALLPPSVQIHLQWGTAHYLNTLQGKMPKALEKIKKSSLSYLGSPQKKWIKKLPFFLHESRQGKYVLKVNAVNWTHKKEKGVIVEYHLYEPKSANKIWEYGQTFYIY